MNKEGCHVMISDLFHQESILNCMHPITEAYITQSHILQIKRKIVFSRVVFSPFPESTELIVTEAWG